MTAPGPVPGVNPYTQAYQKKQFDAEQVTTIGSGVLTSLATPATSAVAAAAITPATEAAHQLAHPQVGIAPGY